jgi:hypothetical protein
VTEATVDWRFCSDAAYHGSARFRVVTEGSASVEVQCPSSCRLLRCAWAVESGPSGPPSVEPPLLAEKTEDHVWRINLGQQTSPRMLELAFAGVLDAPLAGDVLLDSPTLVALEVERTAWCVTLPPGWHITSPDDAQGHVAGGREVVSLVAEGPQSHTVRLGAHQDSSDSLWRRIFVLVVLLGAGGGLAWTMGHFQLPARSLLWLGVPLGLAWWQWLAVAGLGLVVAAASGLIGLGVTLRAMHRKTPITVARTPTGSG